MKSGINWRLMSLLLTLYLLIQHLTSLHPQDGAGAITMNLFRSVNYLMQEDIYDCPAGVTCVNINGTGGNE